MSAFSATVEGVLARLNGVRCSGVSATAKCPSHDDRRASLSVSEGEDGRALLTCHAGCDLAAIVSKLGMTVKDLFPPVGNASSREIVATYDYRDSAGTLRYQVVRFEPKDFRQRRPDGAGGWIWKMKGVTPLPYRLPELIAANPSDPVLIAEGEKDVDRIIEAGMVATTNHGGAGKWRSALSQYLAGRNVVLIPDNDDAGRRHVAKVAASLKSIAALIRVLKLQNLPEHGDVSDWLMRGGSVEELRHLIERAENAKIAVEEIAATTRPVSKLPTPATKINVAQLLIGIAEATSLLFHDERQNAHAAIGEGDDDRRIVSLNSRSFSTHLAGVLYTETGRVANGEAIASAKRVLAHRASAGLQHELHNRFAYRDGAVWIDLANARQQAVKVTADGWEVARPPILFRGFRHQTALPLPVTSGDLTKLASFVNAHTTEDMLMLKVWIAAAMLGHVPRPILDLYGPQGAAKTTTAKMIRRLTDPSAAPTSYLSRRDEELALCLETNAVPLFDNVGEITARQAEILCSAVTGAGFSKRELYTDSDEVLYSYRRAILLTGINVATVAPDLLDRFLLLQLDRIDRGQRRSETALWQAFEVAAPTIFTGILDALSHAMRLYPAITEKTTELYRMADFGLWGAALSEGLGFGGEAFLAAYGKNVSAQTEEVLEADPIARAIRELVATQGDWSGSPSDLMKVLRERVGDEANGGSWPKQANSLSRHVRTLQATLADVGISVENRRKNKVRTLVLRAANRPQQSSPSSLSSPVENGRKQAGDDSDDGDDGDDTRGYSRMPLGEEHDDGRAELVAFLRSDA
jgi:hypothetical protein